MGTIIRNCPHCHAANVSFASFADFLKPSDQSQKVFLTAFSCGNCHSGYFAEFYFTAGKPLHGTAGNLEKVTGLDMIDEYPKPQSIEAPQYLPENIQAFFVQAAHTLNSGNLDASAMMSRKTLEVAVKKLHPEGTGNLFKRIEKLYDLGIITNELKNWAHVIRDDGNEAAHEELPVTPEFADELLSFSELFLMYTFTMPGMVEAKKGKSSENA
ncbi:protein of unknown function [Marinobacter sp. es.048]|uniref:DUF4145 domain-containing protein n=1 Tax=Marinobacter sp. es.048 TaxID=1761795 RepID=UPI000B58DB8C|nr:DUF4145 domain-containing protein [Marinobacter sp. es.048]SNC62822.1 protein of unknown function [Marinobacter sp. es.048]